MQSAVQEGVVVEAEEGRAVTYRSFRDYGRPLEMVTSFRYLGRVILAADNDWPAVVRDLARARAVWKRMTRILSREGAEPRVSGFFFKSVVQAVLLFGAKTWVVTPRMGRVLGGFQDQVARPLTGQLLRRRADGKWEYNSTATAREEAGFETMEECIRRSQNTVTQYIAPRSLLGLCEGTERTTGARVRIRWWDQADIDLVGARETAEAAVEADKGRLEE